MVAKIENGWGSVFNGGITGGAGGIEIEFTDFIEMWVWLSNNLTTAAIVTYTGPDFNRIGFPDGTNNSSFTLTSRFEIIGLQNKTIYASQGQTLTFCTIRFRTNTNIIWQNWKHFDSLDDLTAVQSDSVNVWVRHCELDANSFDSQSGTVDGSGDVTLRSNYIAFTDCYFRNSDKTCLVSSGLDEVNDVGKMKVTFTRNKFENPIQRVPNARYGDIGFHFNIVNQLGLVNFANLCKVIQVGKLSRIFSYRNNYQFGNLLFEDRYPQDGFPIEEAGGLKSVEDVIGTYNSGTSEIRPELVTWSPLTEPNYTLETWTAAEALAYVDQWAGATMHLMDATTYDLTVQSSNPTFGTVSKSLSNPVTAGATDVLTATPVGTGVFQGWYLGSVSFANLITTDNPYSRVVNSDATIIASFIDGTPIPPEQPRKKWAKKRPVL